MPVQVKINGEDKTFDTQAMADEAVANAANVTAARVWAKAAEGGSKYRAEAFGLAIVRHVVDNEIKTQKLKAKDLSNANISAIVEAVDDDDLDKALAMARELIKAHKQLRDNHQAPMKGGRLPRDVAASCCVIVRPESGAAQREVARANVAGVL